MSNYITQGSSPVTHYETVHKLNSFVCSSLFRVPRQFIIFYTLPSSPKFSSPFLHHSEEGDSSPKVLMVIMNFLQGHAVITEVLYGCSNFNFVHFLSLTHPSRLLRIPTEINSFEILFSLPKMLRKLSTDWGFISVYLFTVYQAENFLIIPHTNTRYIFGRKKKTSPHNHSVNLIEFFK